MSTFDVGSFGVGATTFSRYRKTKDLLELAQYCACIGQPKRDPLNIVPEDKQLELFKLYALTESFTQTKQLCGIDPKTVL